MFKKQKELMKKVELPSRVKNYALCAVKNFLLLYLYRIESVVRTNVVMNTLQKR